METTIHETPRNEHEMFSAISFLAFRARHQRGPVKNNNNLNATEIVFGSLKPCDQPKTQPARTAW